MDGVPPLLYPFRRDSAETHRRESCYYLPVRPFDAGDGKSVVLGLQNEREWVLFCKQVLNLPQLADDPRFGNNTRRVANRPELAKIIHNVFRGLTAAELLERLDRRRSPAPGSIRWKMSGTIRNSRRGNGGGPWIRPRGKSRR